jgi:hypothetical protein
MIWQRALLFIVVTLLATCTYAVKCAADDSKKPPANLAELLARPILPPKQSLTDVQKYCDTRIARMPTDPTWSDWQHEADRLGRAVLDNVVFRGVPDSWRSASRRVEWQDTMPSGPGYHIRKLRYEALPGLWIPALLYEPDKLEGRVPVVLNVNGHDSNGKAAPYKQLRCINLAKRGMLALNVEWLNMGQLQGDGYSHNRMNQLDLCGTSGLAVFFLAMQRGLDILVDHPHADVERVAMAGLSGGGWQTIFLSSLDRRVTLANPVAGYSSFKTRVNFFSDLGDSEQTPTDLASIADYTHLTAMRAPRPTLLTYNSKDQCCFLSDHALQPLLDATTPVFKSAGVESRLRSHVNSEPGTHNFERDNREAFYKMIGDHFFAGDAAFNAKEIESEAELKKAEELNVLLPNENLDFHKIAQTLMADLPAKSENGDSQAEALSQVVRFTYYKPVAEIVEETNAGDTKTKLWRIKLGDDWNVPVVEMWRGDTPGKRIALVTSDTGRASANVEIENLLADGFRVLAIDPFYVGESKIEDRGYLFALLVSSVGSRPIGVQASQLAAVNRWSVSEFGGPPQRQIAIGPRQSLAALIAAATSSSNERPAQLELHGSLGSLREVIEKNWGVDEYPEMFCFGLLKLCDINDMIELAKPCEVIRK